MSKVEDTKCTYKILGQLGRGAFGIVNKVKKNSDSDTAMKIIESESTVKQYGLPSVLECDIMSRLKHPNLVQSLHIYNNETCSDLNKEDVAIVMPLYEISLDKILLNLDNFTAMSNKLTPDEYNSKLLHISKKSKPIIDINWFNIFTILHDLAKGLTFLHYNNLLHLDIKLENCLISKYNNPVGALTDFGLAMYSDTINNIQTNQLKITSLYRPPEMLSIQIHNKKPIYLYDTKCDIWSLGIVYYYILARKYPSLPNYEADTVYKDIKEKFDDDVIDNHLEIALSHIPDKYQRDIIYLLKGMLQFSAKKRFTMEQVFKSKLFTSLQSYAGGIVREPKLVELSEWLEIYDVGLDTIITYMNKVYPYTIYRLLFLTIDLYHRALPYYEELKDDDISGDLMNIIVATCIMLATKIYELEESFQTIINHLQVDIDIELLVQNEKLLINKLFYIINRVLYSDWFVSKEHLINFYKDGIISSEKYSKFNHSEWLKSQGVGKVPIATNYRISDYLEDINYFAK